MKRPYWLPRNIKYFEGCIYFKTIRIVGGIEVPVHNTWGAPYPAMPIELEELLFFSRDIAVMKHNGTVLADTTDRIGTRLTVQRCSRAAMGTGERSVIYIVRLAEGVAVESVEGELSKLWDQEACSAKAIRLEDGTVWRSTLKEDL